MDSEEEFDTDTISMKGITIGVTKQEIKKWIEEEGKVIVEEDQIRATRTAEVWRLIKLEKHHVRKIIERLQGAKLAGRYISLEPLQRLTPLKKKEDEDTS